MCIVHGIIFPVKIDRHVDLISLQQAETHFCFVYGFLFCAGIAEPVDSHRETGSLCLGDIRMELVIGAAAVFTVSGADNDAADAGGLDSLEIDLSLMFGDVDHLSVEIGGIGILAANLPYELSVGIQPVGLVPDLLDAGQKRAVMAFLIAARVVFAP